MASATVPSPLDSSQDKTNGFKLIRLIVDGGTEALRNVFLGKHPGKKLEDILNSYPVKLSNVKIITRSQWNKLYPAVPNKPNIKEFDITLLCILLRNICGLSSPSTGWDAMPCKSDNSSEANIVRIKCFRNDLYHTSDIGVGALLFEWYWKEISSALVGLGINQGEIDRLKSEQCGKEEVHRVLKEWNEMEVEVKLELKRLQQTFGETSRQLHDMYEIQQQDHKVLGEIKDTVKNYHSKPEPSSSDNVLNNLAMCDFSKDISLFVDKFVDGTRGWVFQQVDTWFKDRASENRAFIITGHAGMGKSVISAVICRNWKLVGQLAGVHFCQHNNRRYNNPRLMLQSLACQMCDVLPQYKAVLVKQLSRNLGQELNSMGFEDLFSLLFKEPFSNVVDPGRNFLVVIDGVDESEYEGRSELVEMISCHLHKLPSWVRFVVTTRPEQNIADELKVLKPLYLESNDENNLKDIQLYFKKKLPCLVEEKINDTIASSLADRSEGLMLYAFFLAELVNENLSALDISGVDSFPVGISSVYKSYFKRLEGELCNNLKICKEKFLRLLNAIAVAKQPFPLAFVTRILNPGNPSLSAKQSVMKAISCISTLLPIIDDHLNFFHKSVKDWLVDNSDFCTDEKVGHTTVAELCTQEFDEVKKRGITPSQLSDSLKYALQHGIQHMLEVSEECESVEKLMENYSTDIELTYGKFFVDSGTAINEILLMQQHKAYNMMTVITKETLNTLLSLLRKYSYMIKDYPHSFFQHVLNEGGKELSTKASHLLHTRYRDIPYLEFVDKVNLTHPIIARYYTSDMVLSFDISPKQDYMVCRCANGSIKLFSLKTSKKEWEIENCFPKCRLFLYNWLRRCYSVVFHPLENVVLAGRLDKVYTITGLCQPGPFSCEGKYSFSSCSFSHNHTRMLTLCGDNENQLLVWNIESGQMIKCIDCLTTITSFRFSSNGKLIATTDGNNMFRVYDVEKDYAIKHEIKQSRCLLIISSFKSDSWFCYKMHFAGEGRIFIFESDHLKLLKSIWSNIFLPVGLNALAEFELVILGRKRDWFNEAGYSYSIRSFAMLDGQMALTTSHELRHISMFNVQQLNEIKSYQDDEEDYFASIISLDGSIVYQMTRNRKKDNSQLSVRRRQTNECCIIIVNSYVSSFVPVKDGVLLLRKNTIPELWNSDLSKCLECFPQLGGTTDFFQISEDLVGCRAKSKVDILNIFNRNIVSTSSIPDGSDVLACNSKREVLTYDLFSNVMSLLKNNAILWQCCDSRLRMYCCISLVFFSAEGDKIIILNTFMPELHILDASTGNYLRGHPFVRKLHNVVRCRFLSVNGNEFLICDCNNNFLYLISVLSGEVLTFLDVGLPLGSLSICLEKTLVAVGIKHSIDFKLIKVRITNEREDKSNLPDVSDKNSIPI